MEDLFALRLSVDFHNFSSIYIFTPVALNIDYMTKRKDHNQKIHFVASDLGPFSFIINASPVDLMV